MTDKLLELEEMLPALGPALDRRRLGESLGRTTEKLQDAERLVNRLRAILEIAHDTAFGADAHQADELHELRREARAFADDLQNASTAEDLRFIHDNYPTFFKSVASAERQVRAHWKVVCEQDFRPFIAIGDLLLKIGVATDLGMRLKDCANEAFRSSDIGAAEPLLRAIREAQKKKSILDRDRSSITRDPEVDKFLTELSNGRATLALVTEGVRDWLARYGSLDQFGVRPLS